MPGLDDILVVACRSASSFVEKVAADFNKRYAREIEYTALETKVFPDGELRPQVKAHVRKREVHLFQCFYNLDDTAKMQDMLHKEIFELVLGIDAIQRAGATNIVLYLPFAPYMGEDKKDAGKVPISAKAFYNLIISAGQGKIGRVTGMDLHASQEVGFVDIPMDNLLCAPVLAANIREVAGSELNKYVIVSPDVGGAKRAEEIAGYLGLEQAIVPKKRDHETGLVTSQKRVIGNVEGKKCAIIDDMARSCDTLTTANNVLINEGGAESVYGAMVTHGVLCPNKEGIPAEEIIRKSGMNLFMTDSIPKSDEYLKRNPLMSIIPIADYFSQALHVNIFGASMSQVIEGYKDKARGK